MAYNEFVDHRPCSLSQRTSRAVTHDRIENPWSDNSAFPNVFKLWSIFPPYLLYGKVVVEVVAKQCKPKVSFRNGWN